MSPTGTKSNATNCFQLELNWTTRKQTVVDTRFQPVAVLRQGATSDCTWPKVTVQTAPTFSRIRVNALNLPISVLSSDRNQSKGTPGYLRRLATALVYNPITKIES